VLLGGWAVHRHWRRIRWLAWTISWAKRWAVANPATTVLWVLVALHVWMLAGLPGNLREDVLRVHSTNLDQLRRDPITVLFSSAMWTDVGELSELTIAAILVLAPAERWLGTRRAVTVFLTGHIGATLITAVWLTALVDHHIVDQSVKSAVDVGVSYGLYCTLAVLCYRLPRRWGLPVVLTFAAFLLMAFYNGRTFTDFGHLMSLLIGLLLYPITLAPSVRARRGLPWFTDRRVPDTTESADTAEERPDTPAPVR
jgi:hypothetical protein